MSVLARMPGPARRQTYPTLFMSGTALLCRLQCLSGFDAQPVTRAGGNGLPGYTAADGQQAATRSMADELTIPTFLMLSVTPAQRTPSQSKMRAFKSEEANITTTPRLRAARRPLRTFAHLRGAACVI